MGALNGWLVPGSKQESHRRSSLPNKSFKMCNLLELSYSLGLPGEFHGQRSLAGYSPWSRIVDTTEQLTFSRFHTIIFTMLLFFSG